jgi:Protein of unknown function (DUF3551)
MRALVLSALIGVAALCGGIHPTKAQSPYTYQYCVKFPGGSLSCYYNDFGQCVAATRDRGGACIANPFRRAY